MANRNFNRFQALEKEVKSIYADVAIGAVGAATVNKALGVASVTRSAAGRYDIVLEDQYTRLMSVSVVQVNSTSQDLTFQVTADNVSGATKTLSIACKAAAVDTDPSSGSRLLVKIDLKNSSSGE